jgi:Bifunctional DNA primase/polymerase, N-terminal
MNVARCLRAALTYAAMGWQVVPLNYPIIGEDGTVSCSCQRGTDCASPGKHPWVKWRDAGGSTDPGLISWWYRKHPLSNVGILTGPSRSGLFVIDIDPDHGGEGTITAVQTAHGPLDTLTAITGSGGRHLLFRYPDEGAKQGAGDLGPGVDTRSDGGLIVAAPSLHASGRRYRWHNWGVAPADLPAWVADALKPKPPPPPPKFPPRNTGRGSRYAEVALERSLNDLRGLADAIGIRNQSLNKTAWALGRLVGAGLISADRVGHELLTAALDIGLHQSEAEATIASGLRSGATQPKDVPA